MIKKILFTLVLGGLILPLAASAKSTNAANPNGQPAATSSIAISPSADIDLNSGSKNWKDKLSIAKAAREAEKLARFQEFGAMLIENRIGLLNKLKVRIQEKTNIDNNTKTQIIADIDKAIADLNTLKAKIAADTDLNTVKTDIRSIFESFKIYSVVAPRGLGESLAAQGQYILGRLEAIQRQLQTMLEQNKNKGKDVSSLQPLMDQITAKLNDAKAQLTIAEEKFKQMTPANTDAAKTAREEGKTAMKKAKDALKEAHRIMKQMNEQLRTMNSSSASPSTSSSPTTSPSISPSASPSIVPSPSAS